MAELYAFHDVLHLPMRVCVAMYDARGWCELNLTLDFDFVWCNEGQGRKVHVLYGHDGYSVSRPYLSYRPIPCSVIFIRTIP